MRWPSKIGFGLVASTWIAAGAAWLEYGRVPPYCGDPAYGIYPHAQYLADRAMLIGLSATVVGILFLLLGGGPTIRGIKFSRLVYAVGLLNLVVLFLAFSVGHPNAGGDMNLCP